MVLRGEVTITPISKDSWSRSLTGRQRVYEHGAHLVATASAVVFLLRT